MKTKERTMRGHRTWQLSVHEAIFTVCVALGATGCACGRTATHDSTSDPDGDRESGGSTGSSGHSGSSPGNAGSGAANGASGGSSTSGGGVGQGGATSSGGAGLGGSGGSEIGGSGTAGSGTAGSAFGGSPPVATGGAPPCDVFEPPPDPNPTPGGTERASLIADFCATLARDGCLTVLGGSSFIGDHAAGCSMEGRLIACEQDILTEYHQWILPPCEEAWKTAIVCAAGATYEPSDCTSAGLTSSAPTRVEPCEDEKRALEQCIATNSPWQDVAGSRSTCSYGPGITAPCDIVCPVRDDYFTLECGGPPGVPMRCVCSVNGIPMGDDDLGATATIYANDCRDAATRAANGVCTNRLDCCIAYFDGERDACRCGSDPRTLGYSTCEAAAQSVGGEVVAICPRFENDPGGCWPSCTN